MSNSNVFAQILLICQKFENGQRRATEFSESIYSHANALEAISYRDVLTLRDLASDVEISWHQDEDEPEKWLESLRELEEFVIFLQQQ